MDSKYIASIREGLCEAFQIILQLALNIRHPDLREAVIQYITELSKLHDDEPYHRNRAWLRFIVDRVMGRTRSTVAADFAHVSSQPTDAPPPPERLPNNANQLAELLRKYGEDAKRDLSGQDAPRPYR